jgi:glutamate-1-semialdehyde 2,1-aminomutase
MSQKDSTQSTNGILAGTYGQSENSLKDIILLPWNDAAALESTLTAHAHEIAAVITEPIMCNSGCIQPQAGYLQTMRKLTAELGIVMIMDEVITGFRVDLGGAHKLLGIDPDLVVIGKALGGGVAISAVGGKRRMMQLIDEAKVSHLGTLNGNCLSTTAAITTIKYLTENDGASLVKMKHLFNGLATEIRNLFLKHGIRGVVNQIGPVMHVMFIDEYEVNDFATFQRRDAIKYAQFAKMMLEEGILLRPNGLWYISTAHQQSDIDLTIRSIDRVLAKITHH